MSTDTDTVRDARDLHEWALHLRRVAESERITEANAEAELLDRSAAALDRLAAAEARAETLAEELRHIEWWLSHPDFAPSGPTVAHYLACVRVALAAVTPTEAKP